MNTIASFRLTDNMFESQTIPTRHIPAIPNEDYDILVGELIIRFTEMLKLKQPTQTALKNQKK